MSIAKTVPAVMHIEMALDMLKDEEQWVILDERKEFRSLGNRLERAVFPEGTTDAEKGYLIGLETARAILAMTLAAVQNKVQI